VNVYHTLQPAGRQRIYAIMDNLDMHHCQNLLLFMLHHPRREFVYLPICTACKGLLRSG
jgi:hypothetical protein